MWNHLDAEIFYKKRLIERVLHNIQSSYKSIHSIYFLTGMHWIFKVLEKVLPSTIENYCNFRSINLSGVSDRSNNFDFSAILNEIEGAISKTVGSTSRIVIDFFINLPNEDDCIQKLYFENSVNEIVGLPATL